MKYCSKCKLYKEQSEFYKNQNWCKLCFKEYDKTPNRKSYNKTFQRKNARKYRYGVTEEDFKELMRIQNNKCAICEGDNPKYLDHSHRTNKVRGILCLECNTGLGKFKDSMELLMRALTYLKVRNE